MTVTDPHPSALRGTPLERVTALADEIRRGGDEAQQLRCVPPGRGLPSGPATQHARLACVFAAAASRRIVDEIHTLAGTSAARLDSPLERKLRDAHGAASHRWVSRPLYADLGAIFLGDEAGEEFAGGAAGPVLGGK